ncbi:MAG: FixH family protein [Armatimonadota bacterium]
MKLFPLPTIALAAAALFAGGCSSAKPALQPKQTQGTLTADFATQPAPPRVGHDTAFVLTLADSGQPVTGAQVEVATSYLSFSEQQGPTVQLMEAAPGHYEAREVSTGLQGKWEAHVTVARPGHPEAKFTFPFSVAK